MKNKEKIKSILLALLVLLSIIFTWSMWTFQPQYDFRQKTNSKEAVAIGEKRQFNEVIKPLQYIYHHNNRHYGFTNKTIADELYETIMDVNVTNMELITFPSKEQLQSFISQNNSIEMIFPIHFPINITNYIMGPIRQAWEMDDFDRIVVSFSKQVIYYVSEDTLRAIELRVEGETFQSLKEKLLADQKQLEPYFTTTVANNQTLYLPEKQIQLNQLTFTTQNIDIVEFKNALFDDLSRVKQLQINNSEAYSDGTRALETVQYEKMMRYINPANQGLYAMDPDEIILQSIEFINEHSGWTDSFTLIDWNEKNESVVFQLMINGYPVFNENGMTTIYQSWRDAEIYQYERSLIDLRFSIDSELRRSTLPSGRELLSHLAEKIDDFQLSLLESVVIGYEFKNVNGVDNIATVQPSWFIKYDGNWEQVHFSENQGGDESGLE